jgi:N-acetylneuraminate synthase
MKKKVKIGNKYIGDNYPAFIVAEIGINHNGDIELAKKLIDLAATSGCDAVKFQKRTPELCVPEEQKNLMRETPWGIMTYLEYRIHTEFNEEEYREIDRCCQDKGILWFCSCWDVPSIDFIERFNVPCYKIASASITDQKLLKRISKIGKPVILSTGMSTMKQIRDAVSLFDKNKLIILHSTSSYPCSPDELNLKMIETLKNEFNLTVGYSGHEVGLQSTYAAVVLGACLIERHITLDRAMWGSDQSSSIEPSGLRRLVRDIRIIENAMGDGIKKVYESEIPLIKRLRIK